MRDTGEGGKGQRAYRGGCSNGAEHWRNKGQSGTPRRQHSDAKRKRERERVEEGRDRTEQGVTEKQEIQKENR